LLPDGSVVVSYAKPLLDAAPGATDLWVLKPNATTKACDGVRNLTNLTSSAASATDFSLSPDRKKVAFLLLDPTVDAGAGNTGPTLYTAAVDGSGLAAPVPGVPHYGAGALAALGASYESGPRWIAGG